jgi:hypothetical protein
MQQRFSSPIPLVFVAAITAFVVASIDRLASKDANAVWTLVGAAAGILGAAAGLLPLWAIYRRVTIRWADLAFGFGVLGGVLGFETGSVIMTVLSVGIASVVVGSLMRGRVRRRGVWGRGPEVDLAHTDPLEGVTPGS